MVTIQELKEKILNGRNIIITTHVNPDGDGITAGLALMMALNSLNKDREKTVRFITQDAPPSYLEFLDGFEMIERAEFVDIKYPYDTFISVDAADFARIGTAQKFLTEKAEFINIDHHISNKKFGKTNYIIPDASSTAEMMYEIIVELGADITKEIAETLYTGIIYDTGNFAFNNVSEKTFRIAAELRKAGIDNEKLSDKIFSNKSEARLKIMAYALNNMKFIPEQKFVYSFIPLEEMKKIAARKEDTEGIVETLRSLDKCDVSMLVREDAPGVFKGSFRSKEKDVNVLAGLFNGGGHAKASGFNTALSIDEILNLLKKNWE